MNNCKILYIIATKTSENVIINNNTSPTTTLSNMDFMYGGVYARSHFYFIMDSSSK